MRSSETRRTLFARMAAVLFLLVCVALRATSALDRLVVDLEEEKTEGVTSQSVADPIKDMVEKNRQRKQRKAAAANATLKSNVNVNFNFMWRKVETRGIVPSAREGHSMVAVEDFMLLFGGCYLDKKCFNDVHVYFPLASRWVRPIIDGVPPAEREGHTATVVGTVMYVYGGSSELGYLRDVFSLNLASNGDSRGEEMHFQWGYPEISGETPAARDGHVATLFGQRIYYFGGYTEQGYSNQLVVLDTNNMAWEYPAITGVKPAPREGHVVVKIGLQRMLIQGGFTNGGCLADTWMFDRSTNAWEMVMSKGDVPAAKENAAAVVSNGKMLLLGGCNFGKRKCKCNLHSLNVNSSLATSMWKEEKVKQPELVTFSPRESHTMTISTGEIYVFGGCYLGQRCFNDILRLEEKGGSSVCGEPRNQCSGHGQCRMYWNRMTNASVHGCACEPGWSGSICSNQVTCKNMCSGHGKCRSNSECACMEGWAGKSCERKVLCPGLTAAVGSIAGKQNVPVLVYGNCSGHGVCQPNGMCLCNDGWYGAGCNLTQKCDNSCSGHGVCVEKVPRSGGDLDRLADMPTINETVRSSLMPKNDSSEYKSKGVAFIESRENRLLRGQENGDSKNPLSLRKKKPTNATRMMKKKRRRKNKFVFNETFPSPFIPDAFCQCFKGYKGLSCDAKVVAKSNLSKVVAHKAGSTHRFSKRALPGTSILDGDSSAGSNFNQQDGGWAEALKADTVQESSGSKAVKVVSANTETTKKTAPTAVEHGKAGESRHLEASASVVLGKGCPSHCSSHGICMQERCYCHTGYTGMSCAYKLKAGGGINVKNALIESGIVKYASTLFVFGVAVPFLFHRIATTLKDGNGRLNSLFSAQKRHGGYHDKKLIDHW